MSTIKKFLNLIFIDGLSGMALGLFSTLIIGTILKQAADLVGGDFGYYLGVFAVMAQRPPKVSPAPASVSGSPTSINPRLMSHYLPLPQV